MFSEKEVAGCTQTLKLNSAAAHNLIFGLVGSCILWPKFNSYTFSFTEVICNPSVKEMIVQMWHFCYLSEWKKREIQSFIGCLPTVNLKCKPFCKPVYKA